MQNGTNHASDEDADRGLDTESDCTCCRYTKDNSISGTRDSRLPQNNTSCTDQANGSSVNAFQSGFKTIVVSQSGPVYYKLVVL